MAKINPISGFQEFLPEEQIAFDKIVATIKQHFELYGFSPLETPAVERAETLLAKGGSDKEIYGLRRLNAAEGEADAKDLALRFDLTVPTARYVAQHYGQLTFPFKRYQIQPVWRGERPQAGRYRQFYQCDIDVINEDSVSTYHDAEIPAAICQIFQALDIGAFTIRLNNRKALQGLVESFGADQTSFGADGVGAVIKVIDDLEKLPRDKILEQLGEAGLADERAADLLAFFEKECTTSQAWLDQLKALDGNALLQEGLDELDQVITALEALGVAEHVKLDPAIARGLDYYTGTVYETRLEDFPGLGSICSGGRYENLTGHFTNKKLPGVGISIGLSRLMTALLESERADTTMKTKADVLVTAQNADLIPYYLELGQALREAGIKTEVYLESRKLGAQMKYAARKGFKVAVIADEPEKAAGKAIVRNLADGAQEEVSLAGFVGEVRKYLG